MTRHILRIDSSARPASSDPAQEGSFSRALADRVVARLGSGTSTVTQRDLATEPLPHITNDTIAAYYTAPDQRTPALDQAVALSDALVAELKAADTLVISVPIYNFNIPSAFKAWLDQVVRIGVTFAYEDGAFKGLLSGKRAVVCYAYGGPGYLNGGPLSGYDHMSPYVEMILNFIGITGIETFAVEATTGDAAAIDAQMAKLEQDIAQSLTDWS